MELVDDARSVRDGLRAFAVMNQAAPGPLSTDNLDTIAAVAEVPQFVYLPAPLRRRKAFSNAGGAGLSVTELSPRDPKAIYYINNHVKHLQIKNNLYYNGDTEKTKVAETKEVAVAAFVIGAPDKYYYCP